MELRQASCSLIGQDWLMKTVGFQNKIPFTGTQTDEIINTIFFLCSPGLVPDPVFVIPALICFCLCGDLTEDEQEVVITWGAFTAAQVVIIHHVLCQRLTTGPIGVRCVGPGEHLHTVTWSFSWSKTELWDGVDQNQDQNLRRWH